MSIQVLVRTFALACVCAILSESVRSDEYSEQILYGHLQQLIRRLDSCHVVFATRGNQERLDGSNIHDVVSLFDFWVSGDHVQVREVTSSNNQVPKWWNDSQFKPLESPLVTEKLDSVPGRKICARPSGDRLWADSRLFETRDVPYPSLYSTSVTSQWFVSQPLPLIELNRSWKPPNEKGSWPVVNLVAEQGPENWKVLGQEQLEQKSTVKVEVSSGKPLKIKLKRHSTPLEYRKVWHVWLSIHEGYFPIRIESAVQLRFNGQRIALEQAPGLRPSWVFRASDLVELEDGIWFPWSGSQDTYASNSQDPIPIDFETIVDSFLTTNKPYVVEGESGLSTRREWHVLKMELIAPATDLWFDPPVGACVHDLDTDTQFIEGVSPEESNRLLGVMDTNDVRSESLAANRSSWSWLFIVINIVVVFILVLRLAAKYRLS